MCAASRMLPRLSSRLSRVGDWREEVLAWVEGELRIYCSTETGAKRRTCLMQDPLYRLDAAMNAMGYGQNPMLS